MGGFSILCSVRKFEQGDEMLLKRVGVVHCPSKWIVKNWNARDAFCSSRSTTLQSIMNGETGLTTVIPQATLWY